MEDSKTVMESIPIALTPFEIHLIQSAISDRLDKINEAIEKTTWDIGRESLLWRRETVMDILSKLDEI